MTCLKNDPCHWLESNEILFHWAIRFGETESTGTMLHNYIHVSNLADVMIQYSNLMFYITWPCCYHVRPILPYLGTTIDIRAGIHNPPSPAPILSRGWAKNISRVAISKKGGTFLGYNMPSLWQVRLNPCPWKISHTPMRIAEKNSISVWGLLRFQANYATGPRIRVFINEECDKHWQNKNMTSNASDRRIKRERKPKTSPDAQLAGIYLSSSCRPATHPRTPPAPTPLRLSSRPHHRSSSRLSMWKNPHRKTLILKKLSMFKRATAKSYLAKNLSCVQLVLFTILPRKSANMRG